jgi:peptidoglycan/LPS O-acetylase OafA/YrhL
MPQREFYIDRLRTVITALVILHHTAITYGAIGGWFWREVPPSSTPSSILLILFCSVNQAYFMGFFFLLAGYFTPASLERKGYARFIGDRFLRLGLPLLAFGLLLGPLTAAIVNYAQGDGFWSVFPWLWRHKQFINGPLWFAQALLIFSLAYCAWRAAFGSPLAPVRRVPRPVPGYGIWLLAALGVGAAAFAIRQAVPVGVNVFGLQLGYFAGYIFFSALGIAAWRYDWLSQLSWKQARPWVRTLAVAGPMLPLGIAAIRAWQPGGSTDTTTGLSWASLLYAFWEPFIAWGIIAAWLLVFRKHMNAPSAIWEWLGRRAYAVYIIHPPVLVGFALLLHGWVAPALIKFGVVGTLACIATWLLADPLVRLPGVRSVV